MMGQHDQFLERLKASVPAVFAVARWLHTRGHTVEIPGLRLAPTATEAEHFVDDGDLHIVVKHRYEVKHLLKTDFSGAHDWPHPHVFVSNVASVDRAGDEVVAYYLVSRDLSHVAVISSITKKYWYKVPCLASNTGNIEHNYACPIKHVRFGELW